MEGSVTLVTGEAFHANYGSFPPMIGMSRSGAGQGGWDLIGANPYHKLRG